MKQKTLLVLAFLLFTTIIPLQAKTIQAFLNYTIFNVPGKDPYIETYLSVAGQTVKYVLNDNGLFQGNIEVTFIFRQDDQIRDFDKYQLFSPEVQDTSEINFSFIDQQRYFLPQGNYDMEIKISDMNADKKPFSAIQPVSLNFDNNKPCFSGIELVKSFTPAAEQNILTKAGFDLVPMVHNFFPESINKLTYYTELYNSQNAIGEGEKFLIVSKIKSFETQHTFKNFVAYKKFDSHDVVPVLSEYDISGLPSGNYLLTIEARDKMNELLARNEIFFQRSNPNIKFNTDDLANINVSNTFANLITNEDSLQEFINCLDPIATDMEKTFIHKQSKTSDLKTKQQFFYNFWLSRDETNPELAWKKYHEQVQIVNNVYSTQISKGYETDRGRVFLQYGPPNVISESYNEPSSYPYEIWHYYQLGDNQRNKKFVFYSHDAITNNFVLLHSDAIGEISNYKWQVFLNNRWYDPYNVDVNAPPDIYGGKADDYFRNPR